MGVSGRRRIVADVEIARGREDCEEVNRQGAVPMRLFGEAVRVMA